MFQAGKQGCAAVEGGHDVMDGKRQIRTLATISSIFCFLGPWTTFSVPHGEVVAGSRFDPC
jgi:hypothetical protein